MCKKEGRDCTGYEYFEIGPNDLDLMMELVKQNRRLIMQYLGLFFTFTFPGILIGILLTYGKFLKDDEED